MTTEITLALQHPEFRDRMPAGLLLERLDHIGGELMVWTRRINGTPEQATYRFETDAQRRSFLAIALDIPGVSLAKPD